jgi:heme/copper-type cytochrome/quinol oxidase subunit 3
MSLAEEVGHRRLPVGSVGHHATGWWAMLSGIVTEGALFAYLLFAYYYIAVQPHVGPWPRELPSLSLALPNTIVLLVSSGAIWFGERGAKRGNLTEELLGIAAAIILGVIFVTVQFFEWHDKAFSIQSSTYGSLYFTITGFHMVHVAVGLLILLSIFIWSWRGYFGPHRHSYVSIGTIYWHFIDIIWLAVFFTFYITPYLVGRS